MRAIEKAGACCLNRTSVKSEDLACPSFVTVGMGVIRRKVTGMGISDPSVF